MLTKDDKKFILDTITQVFAINNKIIDKKFKAIDEKLDINVKRFESVGKKYNNSNLSVAINKFRKRWNLPIKDKVLSTTISS